MLYAYLPKTAAPARVKSEAIAFGRHAAGLRQYDMKTIMSAGWLDLMSGRDRPCAFD
ncbi:hypothetical protein MES4922_20026 [Mesorhizobium ventifaucium]|uniref:Uncharacterized protein n=1 Tax=Mesorhizobium ventifaucium TaxID=666020 RepID=A0ABM9DQF1_9HYPH|nr:hypothetical protein MES4922_20026 [Mesorhizobium ventifaucium]